MLVAARGLSCPWQKQVLPPAAACDDFVAAVCPGARGKLLVSVQPAPGLALLHLHGEDRCLEHEAKEVLAGSKYVLRSDVVFAAG